MRTVVPNKGHLHELTIELLERAGLYLDNGAERKLCARTVDPDVTALFVRTANTPEHVRDGTTEVGIAGLDRIHESGHELGDLLDLKYRKCRFVLVAPEDGDTETIAGVSGKVIATEFLHIARTYSEEEGIDTEVVKITGVIELTPYVEIADVTVDITSTGITSRVSRLAVADEVLSSPVRLFAHPDVVDDPKIQQLLMAFESIRFAEGGRYLMMNVSRGKFNEVKGVVPGLDGLIVTDIVGDSTAAVYAVANEYDMFKVVSDLKNIGASGTLVTEAERLVE